MSARVRIGIVDSGLRGDDELRVVEARRFFLNDAGGVASGPARDDPLGHGTEVSRLILEGACEAELLHAQVFDASFRTAPVLAAAGLDWLVEAGARIVNMSFGLSADRAVLREACARAVEAGIVLVAAAPAQGAPCYPAAYKGVIAVTGDARCAKGEVSDLTGVQADFGTWCASPERGGGPMAGASAAAASFTGLAASFLARQPDADRSALCEQFRARAVAVGPERRTAGIPGAPDSGLDGA
jgi:subtilisin family serine protease